MHEDGRLRGEDRLRQEIDEGVGAARADHARAKLHALQARLDRQPEDLTPGEAVTPGALERSGDDRLQTVPGGVGLAEGELREAGRGQQALVDAQKLETFDPASSQHKGREMEGIEGPERHRGCHPPCEVAHRWSQLPDTQRPRGVAKQETTGTTSSYIPEKIFQGCATTMQP